jgi:SAM-dependent methyltransferase
MSDAGGTDESFPGNGPRCPDSLAAAEWRRITAPGKAALVRRLCQNIPHRTILDIGCREGYLLENLREAGFGEEFYGIDATPGAVDRLRGTGLTEVLPFDGYIIPYGDRRFELAVLGHIVEHLEHPRCLLREAGRVARHVLVDVPLEDHLLLPLNSGPETAGHINVFSYKGIRRLLQTSGFEVCCQAVYNVSLRATRHLHGWKAPFVYLPKEILVRAAPRMAASLTTYNCALLCRFTGVCDPLPERVRAAKRVGVYVQRPT